MSAALLFLPNVEKRVKDIFTETDTQEAVINIYALKDNGKSEDLSDYTNVRCIVQKTLDQDNQNYALEELKDIFSENKIRKLDKEDIISAVESFYNKEGELLLINEVYVDLIEEIEGFENFSQDIKFVHTVIRTIETEADKLPVRTDITDTPFTVYVAGCDTRSGRLNIYGRTDVNLLVTVNPNTKQILIVGIPRDSYIPNPALDNGYDKLTHLGNNGIYNTMEGVSKYFNIDINYYGEVIFDTFKRIIDSVDGIDVDNPYGFSSGNIYGEECYFNEGLIHLNGKEALLYVRARKTLPNGDYGRNEHQTIVLKAFIKKMLSPAILSSFSDLLDALSGQFMTDIKAEDLFKLARMQMDEGSDWDIITYHLGGTGDMQGTASMGYDRLLYVVHLFESQKVFIHDEIEKMYRDERISQGTLPQDDETTYIPN